MQPTATQANPNKNLSLPAVHEASEPADVAATAPGGIRVIRRNGKVTAFDDAKINIAMTKAFLAVEGGSAAASSRVREKVDALTAQVVMALTRHLSGGGTIQIEDIQDQVELALMRAGEHKVARDYVIYREQRSQERKAEAAAKPAARKSAPRTLSVKLDDGNIVPLNEQRMRRVTNESCTSLTGVNAEEVVAAALRDLYDGIPENEVSQALMLSARAMIEKEPNYTYVSARLLMDALRHEATKFLGMAETRPTFEDMKVIYPDYFREYIHRAAALELLDAKLALFDLDRLGKALLPERDMQFDYLGLQTLYDRYFIHSHKTRFELPQAFFMRVAMGLAMNELDREARAIEFYTLLSSFDFMSSTPTLFNSGTLRPQLSSCYLTTVPDDLHGIFGAIHDNAMLSKFAGGLGNDWTPVRGQGAYIKGTNGKSNGVVPFMKVANDTAVAVNQGGKRKGAVCGYLETWHRDIEEFLDLRKNTGDDRRRTHDMNTANWVPDLFMKRVMEDGPWTLFSPEDTPDLHDLVGAAFEKRYSEYERMADEGKIKNHKRMPANQLWRKMLSMLFETGHPWITFKDPCNLRSPQQHVGVVHSSNLCCIAADQRVVTDRGMLTVGELYRQGGANKVVGLDGVYNASEMLLPRPNAPMVEIETAEGYTHKVTPDHKVWVQDRGWVEAQHLSPGDKLLTQQQEGLWGRQHEPELSYLMGLIAGDGTFGRCNVHVDIWENDFFFLDLIEGSVHAVLQGNTVLYTTSTNLPVFYKDLERARARLSSAPLKRLLEQHGFSKATKLRVPEVVWSGDRETVAAYLKGLYQADGTIQGSHEVTTMSLASTSLELIRELQILWANFGVKTSINRMRGHEQHLLPDGRGGEKHYWAKPLYRLLITSVRGCQIAEQITELAKGKGTESASRFLANLGKQGYEQKLHATFLGLKQLPAEDAFCLTVDSDTHAWTVNGLITKNTEITLNTKANHEIAVCNLGSVNLVTHIRDGKLDVAKLEKTVSTAMRMLDNVIEYNYYSVPTARNSNLRHRPVGLGIMGFNDALYKLRLPYETDAAVEFADRSMEAVSYFAIKASSNLAEERGAYPSFKGSLWSQGILPHDSIRLLAKERGDGKYLKQDSKPSGVFNWDALRERVKTIGMRNSNTMAIAPTATIANITGVSQSIEPTYQNLYVKSNLSGEFTVINQYLVDDLKKLNLWDEVMVHDLKYYDGSVQKIDRLPAEMKELYKCAFEVDAKRLVDAGSRRQKWIDQSQSLNLYMAQPSGKKLDELYKHAWLSGLKTTYYLRTLGATHAEKTTITDNRLNTVGTAGVGKAGGGKAGSGAPPAANNGNGHSNGNGNGHDAAAASDVSGAKVCSITDPECEACQ